MLLNELAQYLNKVETAVRGIENGHIERYEEEILSLDRENQLIFRYDDTPHFPNFPSFPHHKHTANQVEAAQQPSIINVIAEAVVTDQ